MSNSSDTFFFTVCLPRFADDFKAVPNHLVQHNIRAVVYSPDAGDQTESDKPSYRREDMLEIATSGFSDGVQLERLPLHRDRLSPISIFRTMGLAWRLGRQNPDATFVMWTIIPILFVGLPLRMLGRKCVFMKTGMGSVFGSNKLKVRFARFFVKLFYRYLFSGKNSRAITHNHEDKQYISDVLGMPLHHIMATRGCGVEPDEFPRQPLPEPREAKVILVPARLLVEKGILEAIEASRLLTERGFAHEMWLSNDIDPGNPSSLTAAQLDQACFENPALKVLGFQPRVLPLFRDCDLVLVPSRYREGLPTALIEAAATGRPVVTTNNYGGRDIVFHEKTGLMVENGDAVGMANCLQRYLEDPMFAHRMAENAYQQFLTGYTKKHMLQRTLEVFQSLGLEVPDTDLDEQPNNQQNQMAFRHAA